MKPRFALSLALWAMPCLIGLVAHPALAQTTYNFLKLADTTTTAPGNGGGTFSAFSVGLPAISANGTVTFVARFTGATNGSSEGIFVSTAATSTPSLPPLFAVARQGDAAPGGGTYGFFSSAGAPVIGGTGSNPTVVYPTFPTSDPSYLFSYTLGNAAGAVRIIKGNTTISGYPGAGISLGTSPQIDSTGTNLVLAASTVDNRPFNTALLTMPAAGGDVTAVVTDQTIAPNTGGLHFRSFSSPTLNAKGDILFEGDLPSAPSQGLFTVNRSGTGLRSLAIRGDAAPGGGTLTTFGSSKVADSGDFTYLGTVSGTPTTQTAPGVAVFRGNLSTALGAGSGLSLLARFGDSAPALGGISPGTFSDFGSPAINDNGLTAFRATVTGTGGTSLSFLYTADPSTGALSKVIGTGDLFQGSNIASVSLGRNALNNAGQMVFNYTLTDGRSGVAVANALAAPTATAPEPTTFVLLATGLLPLLNRNLRKRRRL